MSDQPNPNPNTNDTKENHMNVTPIVRTIDSTIEHTFKFVVGDTIAWNDSDDTYTVVSRTVSSFGTERYDVRYVVTGRTYTNIDCSTEKCKLVTRAGLTETVPTTLEEVVNVEHKYAVGDTFRKEYFIKKPKYTVVDVRLNDYGTPIYRYTNGGWDIIADIDANDTTLVGGPSYVAPEPEPVKTGLDILREARELLSDRENWVKGEYSLGFSFCAIGAINKASGESVVSGPSSASAIHPSWEVATNALAGVLGDSPYANVEGRITSFNDRGDVEHEHVIAAFDKAIAELVLADVL